MMIKINKHKLTRCEALKRWIRYIMCMEMWINDIHGIYANFHYDDIYLSSLLKLFFSLSVFVSHVHFSFLSHSLFNDHHHRHSLRNDAS